MSITLRPYQLEAVEKIREAIRQGHRKIMLVIATGGGKSVIAASILNSVADNHKSGIFVAPRREIVHQTAEKLKHFGCNAGILMAGHDRVMNTKIQVASIQTYHRRKKAKNFIAPGGNVIIFDEAHLSLARTWQEMAKDYPGAILLGTTATACRADGAGLGSFWDVLIEVNSVKQLIDEGWLVPSRFYAPVIPNLKGVKVRAGDYAKGELEDAMDKKSLIGDIVESWVKYGEGRPTVVFASGVAHSRHITEEFEAAGYNFLHLDGRTSKEERDGILRALENGDVHGVSNCNVLTEGWDMPKVSCLVDAQPTKSYGRHLQKVGRVLRPAPGKSDAIVIDHAGNVYRHGFPEEAGNWTLDDTVKIQEVRKEKRDNEHQLQTCRHCFTVFEGSSCPACGAQVTAKARQVNTEEGRLIEVKKKPKKVDKQKIWNECLFQIAHRGGKVGASAHLYRKRVGVWPRKLNRLPQGDQWQLLAKDFIELTRISCQSDGSQR